MINTGSANQHSTIVKYNIISDVISLYKNSMYISNNLQAYSACRFKDANGFHLIPLCGSLGLVTRRKSPFPATALSRFRRPEMAELLKISLENKWLSWSCASCCTIIYPKMLFFLIRHIVHLWAVKYSKLFLRYCQVIPSASLPQDPAHGSWKDWVLCTRKTWRIHPICAQATQPMDLYSKSLKWCVQK